jgi:tRNA-dihydrouridine synthase
MEQRYPKLAGIMIGRGLLARPSLAAEYKQTSHLNSATTSQDFLGKILQMHQIIFENACQTYQGDSQILSHIQSFWEYLEPNIPKKTFKKIKKAGKLNEYIEAISMLQAECKASN